jgi:hypothetical protein
MSVESRIETSSIGVEFITLSDAESEYYRGAGDAVAYFNDAGEITGIDYIGKVPEDGAKALADKAMRHGNAWLGMCSTYEFCDLRKLDADYTAGFARIMRLVAENWDIG